MLSLLHFLKLNFCSLQMMDLVQLFLFGYYDGSVEYFNEPKHIALGLFSILILLVAFVPYTFILLCGHWLIAYSDKCFLSWLNKIKPFMDIYYAPFKQEARYWI